MADKHKKITFTLPESTIAILIELGKKTGLKMSTIVNKGILNQNVSNL